MSLEGVPLLLRPGRGKADLLCGCVRRLVRLVKGSINELLSVTVTSQSLTFSPRAHCWAASWSTCRRSRRSDLFPNTITITCTSKYSQCENIFTVYTRSEHIIMGTMGWNEIVQVLFYSKIKIIVLGHHFHGNHYHAKINISFLFLKYFCNSQIFQMFS